MKDILVLNKQVGETPLACMDRFRVDHPEYAEVKMTYAGRLDPMAEGVLVVLCSDKVHEKEKFLKLPKEYICTAIIGVGTDTYDILGIPEQTPFFRGGDTRSVTGVLESFIGTFTQEYPPYSSKTVGGKQLHTLARKGGLEGLEMPKQMVTVEAIWDIEIATVLLGEILPDIVGRIAQVTGDFRQPETIKAWETLGDVPVQIITFKIRVSGGTYVRGIVNELGIKLGTKACIYKLFRGKVGDYTLEKA